MSGERLSKLRRAQSGDTEAAGQLVEENAGLIWSVARRYFGRGVEAEDLYQLRLYTDGCAMDGIPAQESVLIGAHHPAAQWKS